MLITATYYIYTQRPDRAPIVDREQGKVMKVEILDTAERDAEYYVNNSVTEPVDWEDWSDTHVSDTDDGTLSHCLISRKGTLRETNQRVLLLLKWTNINA